MATGIEATPEQGSDNFNPIPGDIVERFSQSKGSWDGGWKVVLIKDEEALIVKEDPADPMKGQTLSVPLEKIRRAA